MLSDQIIEPGTLAATGQRVAVSVRIPWYRTLPLSSVTDVRFEIDGVPVESPTWTLNDRTYRLDELPARHDTWWYVLDSAVLEGDRPELPDVAEHDVFVHVGLYIPYLPAGDGVLAIGERDRKSMTLKELS